MNEALKAIARRRSARKFLPQQLKPAELEAILAAAMQAPSAHNDQSTYFAVVQNRALIDEMSEDSKVEMKKDAISPLVDVSAAIENMLIAAESLGIGSCWIGFAKFYFTGPERPKKLGIPEGYDVYYGVALGYKGEGPQAKPPARKYEKYFHVIE